LLAQLDPRDFVGGARERRAEFESVRRRASSAGETLRVPAWIFDLSSPCSCATELTKLGKEKGVSASGVGPELDSLPVIFSIGDSASMHLSCDSSARSLRRRAKGVKRGFWDDRAFDVLTARTFGVRDRGLFSEEVKDTLLPAGATPDREVNVEPVSGIP
jgi:hypothetical protein